jgi:hypothetical protein
MTIAEQMQEIISDLTKSLCFGRIRGPSIFVSTGVSYPNGVDASVRIDPGFIVSDDGYACVVAETMKASNVLNRIAPGVASRSGITFERGTFLLTNIARSSLPVAVSLVANSSARAVERVVASLEQPKLRRGKDLFEKKLRAAFGDEQVIFDLEYKGATGKNWGFDAGVKRGGDIVRLFELVSPTTQAVAMASIKISDVQALPDAPLTTAALVDYDKTEPALRSLLSNAGGIVIAANDEVSKYILRAA